MNILFVIKTMSAAGGGAERVLAAVTGALAARGHEVHVASFDDPDTEDFYQLHKRIIRHRIGIGSLDRRTSLIEFFQRVRALKKLHDCVRPDVAIGFMHSSYVLLGLALWRRSTPVIASEHIDYSHWKRNRLEFAAIRASLPLFSAMTVVSEIVRKAYPDAVARKMTPVGNPVTSRPKLLADIEGGARKTMLSVGRLSPQKDHRTLIEAFSLVAKEHPDWDLRIIGQGATRPTLERQIQDLALEDRVFLPGVTHDIEREYRSAQLYVHSAIYESFGLVTAEALAHGLPAIGFADCPGTNEIILDEESGILVDGNDRARNLAIALDRLMSSVDLRKRFGAQGPASVERFSLAAVAEAWESLIFSVAEHHPPRKVTSRPGFASLKITHLVATLGRGGAERVAIDLANQQARQGHKVALVIGSMDRHQLIQDELDSRIDVEYVHNGRARVARYAFGIIWLCRRLPWLRSRDIVHAHLTFPAVIATILYKLRKPSDAQPLPRIVETYHAVGVPIPRLHRRIHAWMARHRDGLILMASDPYWERFRQRHSEVHSCIIPNGMAERPQPSRQDPEARDYAKNAGLPEKKLILGSVGRLVPARRPNLYVPVFANVVKAMGSRVHFLMAGDGPERANVMNLAAEAGILDQLHLPGFVMDSSLPRASMDLYVTINVGSVTGLNGLEAAFARVPIIAIQMLDRYVPGENDWIWSSSDLEEVSREAVRLLRDPQARAAVAERQHAYVQAHHTISAMVEAYDKFYFAAGAPFMTLNKRKAVRRLPKG